MKRIIILIAALAVLVSGCSAQTDEIDTAEVTTEPVVDETAEVIETQETQEPVEAAAAEIAQVDPKTLPENSLNGVLLNYEIPEDSSQIILVVVDDSREKMYLMELAENGLWQVAYGPFEAEIGRNGLGKEKEGDGKSPVGVFDLGYAFGRHGAPSGTTWPWRDTVSGDLWIEDSDSQYYNLFVKEDEIEEKDWKNGSNLNISAYEKAIEVRYNEDRTPGLGSAIFIHCWADSTTSTSGCTAISEKNITKLIQWMDPLKHTVLVQTPYDMLGNGDLEYLCDFDYSISYDIKLSGDDNFFGEILPDYNTNTVITTTEIIEKILDINDYLKDWDRQLYIYEAYRPIKAYDYINEWILRSDDATYKDDYYPNMKKEDLIKKYFEIKDLALYPRAQVIHVGLADMEGNPLDMGGEYFVFDKSTSYEYTDISAEAEYNRELLHDIMVNTGFTANTDNWWEYIFDPDPYGTKYDEIIQ